MIRQMSQENRLITHVRSSAHHPRKPLGIKRSVACQRCHSQKVKCTGGKPCSRCLVAGCEKECRYIKRDRKVRVDESYLEQLIQDSQELHRNQRESVSNITFGAESGGVPTSTRNPISENDSSTRNPLLKDWAWFQTQNKSALPIYVSEVACTAFATRLCQCLNSKDASTSDMSRMRYVKESALGVLSYGEIEWPSLARARLLVNTALGHANPPFHLALRKTSVDYLQTIYQNASFDDPVLVCKYFALFALGEVCSVPSGRLNNDTSPGTTYYARAINLIFVLPERPNMAHIEALLILALCSQFLNRWHSAYVLVGIALRLGLSAGFHHNIPETQYPDPIARENRIRVWWTIYIFDRFWGLKLGLPMQVNDDDIHVDFPSNLAVETFHDEFADSSYQVAVIELARISTHIMRNIYSRQKSAETLLQREQKLLNEMKQWMQSVPDHIRLQPDTHNPRCTVLIHLQFNYCLILAIRPLLLGILDHIATTDFSPETTLSPALAALTEACIHSARHTLILCADEWTKGSISVFGYAFAQYIFTSSLVLVISNLLPYGNADDLVSIDTAAEMLRSFAADGNLMAGDLYEHIQKVQKCQRSGRFSSRLPSTLGNTMIQVQEPCEDDAPSVPHPTATTYVPPTNSQIYPTSVAQLPISDPQYKTAEMSLYQPTMEDFLTQSVTDIGLLDPEEISTNLPDSWPSIPLWTNDF
ncbi:fungal-specific transcription factor domain-containing protein [Aspergillus flavus]|uniref:Fungal-specific transcription factor domain-containing protein n=1 Tax=Aspergillus flavus TaxID=5059 RepID=A0A5N6HDQ0_ASPFL|nr:fungal-specific transcription factor domain-containing protein [Aspergillus flavus]